MSSLSVNSFKPFKYPQFYDYWLQHEQMHWLHTEIPLNEDLKDWALKLTESERNFLTHIFRFFTQGDIDVAEAYSDVYLPLFKTPEIRMMLLGFGAREALHIAAYSHLIETLGMPESIYNDFMQYKEMHNKHTYLNYIKEKAEFPVQLAVFSGFTEGMQLFSSFVMLLNFARHGKMRGMSQIITWSINDESLHTEAMIKLFRVVVKELGGIDDAMKRDIYLSAAAMVELEDAFIDLAFGTNEMQNLTKDDMKKYIRYITDRRLISMGMKGIFKVTRNPLPWVAEMINAPTHTNFFENKVTDYSKGALTGSWGDVWA